ncbi:MAG: hypothetical protein ABW116_10015 [Candidatus Sedimenticola sp. 20ELBAFRAG]
MKLFTTALLLAPAIVLAASPHQNPMQDPQLFAKMKERILPAMTESLPYMEKTKACVSKSSNTKEFNDCAAIKMEFRNKMMANEPGHKDVQPPQPPKLEWSPELKQQALTDIELSINNTTATIGCLKSSNNREQMSSCMQKTGIKSPKQPQHP